MKKEEQPVQEVKRLVKRAAMPRWLHRFGPKRYELWQHLLALLARELFQLSYRRTTQLLRMLGLTCASKSTLQYTASRVSSVLWQRLLCATLKLGKVCVAAIDGTGLARSSPSWYYIKRINGKPAKRFVKLSILVDTARKKVLAACVRMLPAHDVRDVSLLLKKTPLLPHKIVADKGYDSESIHERCFEQGIVSLIPPRKITRSGFYRRKMLHKFNLRTYHRREMVESVFSSLKRKFGSSVRCCKARTLRAQVFCRLILHNLISSIVQDLGLSLTVQ